MAADAKQQDKQLGGLVVGGLDRISTDNADALDKVIIDKKKKAKEGTKAPKPKTLAERKAEMAAHAELAGAAKQRELKIPSAIAKKMNRRAETHSARANPNYLAKLGKIKRYKDNRVLAPIIIDNVPGKVYNSDPQTEAECDAVLGAFKEALNAKRMDGKEEYLLAMGASAIEKVTGEGALIGMDLKGLTQKVWADREDVRTEMEEFKCEYGGLFRAPWYVRILQFYAEKAKQTHDQNNFLAQEVTVPQPPKQQLSPQSPPIPVPKKYVNLTVPLPSK